jgi:hypothetical protein
VKPGLQLLKELADKVDPPVRKWVLDPSSLFNRRGGGEHRARIVRTYGGRPRCTSR